MPDSVTPATRGARDFAKFLRPIEQCAKLPAPIAALLFGVVAALLLVFMSVDYKPFIYFQFQARRRKQEEKTFLTG